MRYFIETYGCQMNKAESAAVALQCAELGWTEARGADEADLVLINTCAVRITAETRALGRIAHYAALKRAKKLCLIVFGCMAERMKDELKKRFPRVDYVFGSFQKQTISTVLTALANGCALPVQDERPVFSFAASHYEPGAFSAFVPIMHGCNNFCSYCIVPYVRGREVSREPAAILHELAAMAERGVREVTLLGQNVNSYRWTDGAADVDFAALLAMIAKYDGAKRIERIRFLSSHPKDLSLQTIDVLASHTRFARHIHLCVQHGSDAVLGRMNRNYTRSGYISLVNTLRSRIPNITISTDILIGFPGETEDDLEATLQLMEEVRFVYAFMYHFNPREGTKAAAMPDAIPDALKKARLARVIELQKRITKNVMKEMLGTEIDVLVESVSKQNSAEVLARSGHDMMVVFKADTSKIGNFTRVRLESVQGNTFRAKEVV